MLKKSTAIIMLTILLVLVSTACNGGAPEPSEPEQGAPQDGPFSEFAFELIGERNAELLEALNSCLAAHRDGTFEEIINHHTPYPADFPPVANLPVVESTDDITIAWRETVVVDANTESTGAIYVLVPIGDSHVYSLEPALFGDADGNTTIGFANSGFAAMGVEEFFAQSKCTHKSVALGPQ